MKTAIIFVIFSLSKSQDVYEEYYDGEESSGQLLTDDSDMNLVKSAEPTETILMPTTQPETTVAVDSNPSSSKFDYRFYFCINSNDKMGVGDAIRCSACWSLSILIVILAIGTIYCLVSRKKEDYISPTLIS